MVNHYHICVTKLNKFEQIFLHFQTDCAPRDRQTKITVDTQFTTDFPI